jgi:hypothetical protein
MIRTEVIVWVSVALLLLFAFVLMPTHERFIDKSGREVDVDPNAPPKPEWLKPISERTGKREDFWGSFFSSSREKMTGGTSQQSGTPPPPPPQLSGVQVLPHPSTAQPTISSTLGSAPPSMSGLATNPNAPQPNNQPWINANISLPPPPGTSPLSQVLSQGLSFLQTVAKNETDPATKNLLTNVSTAVQNATAPPSVSTPAPVNAPSTLGTTSPYPDLFGPGPTVKRGSLVSCTCASQSGECPVHP